MFSYYTNSCSKCGEKISVETLVSLIQNHPRRKKVLQLHNEPYGSEKYKVLKNTMPVLTPHCSFKNNGPKGSDNIESFSNYFYFDVDAKDITHDIESYKNQLIINIGKIICLLGKSVGGRGLFFYVKVADTEVNQSNFSRIREYLIDTYLKEIPIDRKCSNINRLHFLPFDKDVYYEENVINIQNINVDSVTHSQYNKYKETHYISRMGERFTSIADLYAKYNFETNVEVTSPLYDIKPVHDYKKLFIPKAIRDGYKHKCFSTIANHLIRLNDLMTEFDLLSFLYYVNKNYTGGTPMKHCKLENLVKNVYWETKENGLVLGKVKVKNIHFNKKSGLSRYEKIVIANKENGYMRKKKSIELIQEAKNALQAECLKVTQVNVARKLAGRLSRGPIEKYWGQLNL